MSALLSIRVDLAAVPVLHLAGTLDRRTTPMLRAEAAHVLLQDPRDVVVDCRHLDTVDSAGLRALRDIRRLLPATGQLVVSDVRPEVRRLMEITAIDRSLLVLDGIPATPVDLDLVVDVEPARVGDAAERPHP